MTKEENTFSDFIGSCKKQGVQPTQFLFLVSIANQTVSLFENTSPSLHLAIDALRLTAEDYKLVKNIPAPRHVSASAKLKAQTARRCACIASPRKSGPVRRREQPSKDARLLATCLSRNLPKPKSQPASCGWKDWNRVSIAAAKWIRTPAIFIFMARQTNPVSASLIRAAVFIWPIPT